MMMTMTTTTAGTSSSAIMDERPTLARALYANVPETSNELGFRKGDILTVIEIDHDGQANWWLCTLRGQRGICPSNYLELLEDKYALPHQPSSKNVQGGSSNGSSSGSVGSHGEAESTSSNSTLVDEPLQDYDVPRSCRQAAVVNKMPVVNPLELYDVPRSGRYNNNSSNTSTDSLARAKNRQSELSLLSTGSSAHLSSASSSSSSSARSSASCDLNGALVSTVDFHADSVSRSSGRSSNSRGTGAEDTESIMSGRSSNEDHQLFENFPVINKEEERFYHPHHHQHHHHQHHHRSSIQSENNNGTMVSVATAASDLYDVPRSEPTSRAQSAMSMSSGLGLSIANSDSKDSLDLYDVPRNGGPVQAIVNQIEAKYDHLHGSRTNCCAVRKLSEHRDSVDSQTSVDPQDLYDVPRSSNQAPSVVPRYPSKLSASMASMSISEDHPSTNLYRSHSRSVDLRRRGFVQLPGGSAKAISCQQLNQHSANGAGNNNISKNDERLAQSSVSLNSQRLTAGASFTSTSTITSHSVEDVKILPLNPRAAVTVCEKLRQEVITSIKSILDFVKPKWRTKDNLTDIMPDLRFSCIRLNLAVKDMVDFCLRSVSNGKKFSIEAHVIKLQRLLTPLINGSQIIQRDIDELDAYFWSAERLSRPGGDGKQNGSNNATPSDALDQLVLCAKSLQHDVTEIANFLALNSTALFRDPERLNAAASTTTLTSAGSSSVVKDGAGGGSGGEEEDYDYVRLVDCESNGQKEGEEESNGIQLLPCDQQLLEFYTTQIASIAPLLSQSISTFISSIQQNDPPKTFNGHLKYVILLAYKMLFAGDTIHRNIANPEIREEVEKKANDLHKSVVSLHEASRTAARDFPRIPPMQAIVDRVWETTAAATQLKKAIFNAATF